jgi:predicted permease
MRWLTRLQMLLRMLVYRSHSSRQLDEELEFHIERQTAENMAAGMNAEDARYAALRAFGNTTSLRDETRSTWRWNGLESFWRDVRYGVRTLRRTPGFLLVAVCVMGLCIGASTSLFTIVRATLLKPLPFRDPSQLVMIYERYRLNGRADYNAVSPGDYYDWRAQTHGFDDMAAWQSSNFNLSGQRDELPEAVSAGAATWNFFPLLGVQPALGRGFTEAEDSPAGGTVLLTWPLFERRFAGNPGIIGKQIHLSSKPYTVIGVLPRWFAYPDAKVQLWVTYQSVTPREYLGNHAFHQSHVIARLRSGISLVSAISSVGALQYRLSKQHPQQAVCEGVMPRTLSDDLAQDVKKPLLLLMCAVLCMLLIGCLNVANLLVARGAARQREVAIRGALGAGRLTLIREQLTESLLICFIGGGVGVLLSVVATHWMTREWKDLPSVQAIYVDGVVLAFACALVFVASLLAGLLPAISSTGKAILAALQFSSSRSTGGSVSRTALRGMLLTVEIAVTVVLLIGAGLLLKSFLRLRSINPGCAMNNVLTLHYSLPQHKYDTPAKVVAFHRDLADKLSVLPGVRDVGIGETVPGAGDGEDDIFAIPERPQLATGKELPDARIRRADPGYFGALQIPLLRGRAFTRHDSLDQANKVIISRQLANEYFPREDPLQKHIAIPLWGDTKYEIVGVVGDTLYQVNKPSQATIYLPTLSGNFTGVALVVRTAYNPLAFAVPVQKQIAALDSELPVSDVLTMEQMIGQSMGNIRLSSTLVLAFAVLSLVLACVGLYGVLSYLMTQRTMELGIRIALGAQRSHVLRLMLLDGLRPALFGLAFGFVASAAAGRIIQSMLYGIGSLDPSVFAIVATTLIAVATFACLLPAWRASRLNPIQALRAE